MEEFLIVAVDAIYFGPFSNGISLKFDFDIKISNAASYILEIVPKGPDINAAHLE